MPAPRQAEAPEPSGAKSTTTPGACVDEQKILAIATDAFDNEQRAEEWLREPNIQLGNRSPIEVINTPEGFRSVETILGQIKYAIFA